MARGRHPFSSASARCQVIASDDMEVVVMLVMAAPITMSRNSSNRSLYPTIDKSFRTNLQQKQAARRVTFSQGPARINEIGSNDLKAACACLRPPVPACANTVTRIKSLTMVTGTKRSEVDLNRREQHHNKATQSISVVE